MEEVRGALLKERVDAQSQGEGQQESEHTSSLAGSQGNGWQRLMELLKYGDKDRSKGLLRGGERWRAGNGRASIGIVHI